MKIAVGLNIIMALIFALISMEYFYKDNALSVLLAIGAIGFLSGAVIIYLDNKKSYYLTPVRRKQS